jgi:predicted nuclease of restriction endonuclease-like (RecB) superfamily
MRQFYETYKDNEFVSPLVTQISWTNHLLILSGTKTIEEKEFYIALGVKEKYSKRELERQISSAYYQRYMLSAKTLTPAEIQGNESARFLDSYVLEFLDLPEKHSESDLKRAIVQNLKNFVLEFGKDFTFIGEEYRIQVGNSDFYIDLLFYHRSLSCLVAFELKIDKFQPEYLGKMNFYLEALDRDHKKPNENPSIGVILCANKEEDVVEYAMSRNLSPTMVAEYTLKLIDKKLLEQKLREFKGLLLDKGENEA